MTDNLFDHAILLSIEEYEKYKSNIPELNAWWWLRSPGTNSCCVLMVSYNGAVYTYYSLVGSQDGCVRPALHFKSKNPYSIGNGFRVGDYDFTVISKDYALCDTYIKRTPFRSTPELKDMYDKWKNYEISDKEFLEYCDSIHANEYEYSNIKRTVDEWFDKYIDKSKAISDSPIISNHFSLIGSIIAKKKLKEMICRREKMNNNLSPEEKCAKFVIGLQDMGLTQEISISEAERELTEAIKEIKGKGNFTDMLYDYLIEMSEAGDRIAAAKPDEIREWMSKFKIPSIEGQTPYGTSYRHIARFIRSMQNTCVFDFNDETHYMIIEDGLKNFASPILLYYLSRGIENVTQASDMAEELDEENDELKSERDL